MVGFMNRSVATAKSVCFRASYQRCGCAEFVGASRLVELNQLMWISYGSPVSKASSARSGCMVAWANARAGYSLAPMRASQSSGSTSWRVSMRHLPMKLLGAPTVRPPGTSRLPVMAAMSSMAWPAWMPFVCWSVARPQAMLPGWVVPM